MIEKEKIFDIYDINGKHVGAKPKSFCHSDNPGVYHKPVWIWIVNDKGQILVQKRAATIVPKFDSNGKVISRKTVIGDTKTICSKRVVPMPDILVNALKEYYKLQQEKSSQYNFDFVDKESFVFCNNDGEIRSYGGTKKIFYTFLKSHNLNKYHIHFHTLRHTFSNTLFEADQNPKVI